MPLWKLLHPSEHKGLQVLFHKIIHILRVRTCLLEKIIEPILFFYRYKNLALGYQVIMQAEQTVQPLEFLSESI